MAGPPTWVIDSADERGVPTVAHCGGCGLTWVRPDGDPWADSLPRTALRHRRSAEHTTTEPIEGA